MFVILRKSILSVRRARTGQTFDCTAGFAGYTFSLTSTLTTTTTTTGTTTG